MDGMADEIDISSIYTPLDPDQYQIRVLHIDDPASEDSTLRCHTEIISLSNEQELQSYEAISYCWGDSTTKVEIEIDGKSHHVTASSEAAMRCICYQHGHRCIWIDAICINQDNIKERNQQVALMGRVYSQAKKVLVWLGDLPTKPFSPLLAVKRLMVDVEKNMGPEWKGAVDFHQPVAPGAWSPEPLKDMLGPPIWAIWASKWFTRLWVVQEIVLGRDASVFHDRESVPFSHLIAAAWASHIWVPNADGLDILKGPENVSMMNTLTIMYQNPASTFNFSLGLLLWQTQTYQRTEPRDKVYAVLGLWRKRHKNEHLQMSINVDYSRSFVEIYAQALQVAILDEGNFDPLLAQTVASLNSPSGSEELPSWAPAPDVYTSYRRPFEMSHRYETDSGEGQRSVRQANDTTSITMNYPPNFRDGRYILSLKGVVADEVSHLSPLMEEHVYARPAGPGVKVPVKIGIFVEYMSQLLSWIRSHLENREDEEIIHMLLNTWMGREVDQTEHGEIKEYGKVFREELLEFLTAHAAGEDLEYKKVIGWPRDVITEAAIRGSMEYAIFVTTDKRLGLGPRRTQPGDKVCILYGGGTPVVLRPCQLHWTWAGPAYLDDLVDGSFFRDLRQEGRLEEKSMFFEIC